MTFSLRPPLGSLAALAACLAAATLTGCTSAAPVDPTGTGGTSTGGTTGTAGTTGIAGTTGGGGTGGATGGGAGSGNVGGTGGGAGASGTAGAGGGAGSGDPGTAGSSGGSSAGAGGSAGAAGGRGGAAGSAGGRGGAAGTSAAGTGGSTGGSAGGRGGTGGTGGTASACPPATPPTGGRRYCTNSRGTAVGNYSYELWAEGTGSGCMTVYGVDAKFSATWSNVEDFLARVGLNFDQTKTHAQIGTITSDFAESKTGSDGLVYIGIYGWTVNPLKEYYILDDWGAIKPGGTASDGTPRTSVGTITVDGEIYDVWKKLRENKPAITGDSETFEQFFSIRRTPRQCGRISISQHFIEWERLGLQLGRLYEAKILMEAQDSTGTIDFTTATVVVR